MQLNLVIIGLDYASSELISKVHNTCNDNGEYVVDGCAYTLNIETINRENDYSFAYDFHSKGIICAFSNRMSFRYVNDVLEKQIFNNLEFKNDIDNLHIILVNDIDKNNEQMDLNELNALRDEAQQLAERLGCLYIDRKDFYTMTSQQNEEKFVETILNNMIEIIPDDEMKLRDSYNGDQPDIRIILSMFCGDPYNVETIVSSLMSEPSCVSSDDRHITFELFLGDSKRRVEVILSSYHGANSFRDELIHGFILLYSTKRKASLATLNAFSMNIPNLPMQMVALTEPGGVNSFFNSELCQILITEGNSLADKLRAHFATASDEENQFKCKFYYFFSVFSLLITSPKPFQLHHTLHSSRRSGTKNPKLNMHSNWRNLSQSIRAKALWNIPFTIIKHLRHLHVSKVISQMVPSDNNSSVVAAKIPMVIPPCIPTCICMTTASRMIAIQAYTRAFKCTLLQIRHRSQHLQIISSLHPASFDN